MRRLACVVPLLALVIAPAPAGAGIVSSACLRASEAVGAANVEVKYARKAARQARTAEDRRTADRRVRAAEKRWAKAWKRRGRICANKPPRFPGSTTFSATTEYDNRMQVWKTYVSVSPPAEDPDGDLLEYRWEATTGSIDNQGLGAAWSREELPDGQLKGGTITVTVYDGATAKPGTFTFTIADGQREA